MESDDDIPQLSAETFLALQEFYNEQSEKEARSIAHHKEPSFEENWQLSQFWYNQQTIEVLGRAALKLLVECPKAKIALISCPSLYKLIKDNLNEDSEVTLFEYDQRFAKYGSDFILYDYKLPLDLPKDLAGSYDLVIADPPFLSDECLTKTAVTIKFLGKQKIVLCTGAIMQDLAYKLLNVKRSSFKPGHINNLANEFCCYTNFDIDALITSNS